LSFTMNCVYQEYIHSVNLVLSGTKSPLAGNPMRPCL
jgi:hypothetical protein